MTDNTYGPLMRSLGRMEGKLDLALQRLDSQAQDQKALEARVERVEKKVTWHTAYVAGITAAVAFGITLLKAKIMAFLA